MWFLLFRKVKCSHTFQISIPVSEKKIECEYNLNLSEAHKRG